MRRMKSMRFSFLSTSILITSVTACTALVSCTNTGGPNRELAALQPPQVPKASPEARKSALRQLTTKLNEQKKDMAPRLTKKDTTSVDDRNKRLKPSVKTALLAPATLVEPSNLQPATVPIPEGNVAVSETVASIPRVTPVGDVFGPLGRFHAKLAALRTGKRKQPITILHIGDSHIASDSFSRGIRTALQSRYGDAGRGMVIPARAYKYGVANQVKFSATGNWRSVTALRSKKARYGLSGVAVSSRSSRSSMKMTSQTGPFDWAEVTVETGPSKGAFTLQVGKTKKRFEAFSKTRGSQTFRITASGTSVVLRPGGGAQTTVLSWASGKDRPGIRYVNFGLIGATVDITKRFNPQLVANDVRRLDPDLIIYGYGTNEGFNDRLNLASYAKRASNYVNSLRKNAPNADVVYLGAASGLRRKGNRACGKWSTPPKLAGLRKQVKKIAAKEGAGYWDWSAAMGGACGINRWAGQGLAAKDRIHLTSKGYRRSANAFTNWLLKPAQSNVRVALN